MLRQDQIELIHREIDGANTPEESAACRSLTAEHPEAKVLEADLQYVASLFDRVGAREPPPHLRRAILDALPRPARAPSWWEALGGPWQAVVEGLRKRPRFALLSAACVGCVVGFGAYGALAGTVFIDRSDTSGFAGSLFEPRAADEVETVQEVAIDVDGGRGRVRVTAGPAVVSVHLELDVNRTLEARLTFDEEAYGVRGFSQLRSEAGRYVAVEPGLIRVTTSGANTHVFVLRREGPVSPLALSLVEDREEIFTTTLSTQGPDQGG